MLTPNPAKMEGPALQELLWIAYSGTPRELGSSGLQLLSQPLSQWKNVEDPTSFCIPAVPLISHIWTAEESVFNRLGKCLDPLGKWTAISGISGAFKTTEEKVNSCCSQGQPLLAVSQDYEKWCGPLLTSDDVHSAVVSQTSLKAKRNNKFCLLSNLEQFL